MSEKTIHEEVLELLASKKINIDQAMQMLSEASQGESAATQTTPTAEAIKIEESEPVAVPNLEPPKPPKSFEASPPPPPAPAPVPAKPGGNGNQKPHWLQIRVRDLDSGRNRVTVSLPLMMVKFGLNIARRFGAESDEIDFNQLATQLKDAEPGVLVDVQDEDSNEHVMISLA